MKPSSLSWPLSVKSTANQMNVARTSPSCRDVRSVSTPVASSTPRPRNATAVESSFSVAASPQSRTMPTNVRGHDLLVAAQGTERRERLARGGRRFRRRLHLRRRSPCRAPAAAAPAPRASAPRAASSHEPKPIVDADRSRDLGAERVGGHRGEPERRRQPQARHAGEHEVGAELLARGLVGPRAAAFGQREREGIEDAGARRVARKRRARSRASRRRCCRPGPASTGRRASPRDGRGAVRARTSRRPAPRETRRR